MTLSKAIVRGVLLAGALASEHAVSHHAVATHFDMNNTIEIRGEVVDFQYKSPHSLVVIEGEAFADGVKQSSEPERWEVESHSVPLMRRLGITPDTFQVGDEIVVYAWSNRKPESHYVFSDSFITAGGDRVGDFRTLGSNEILADNDARGLSEASVMERLSGRWTIAGPPNLGRFAPLPLNETGEAARAAYDETLSPANTCEAMSVPMLFYGPYLSEVRFEDGTAVLHNQVYDVVRRVPIGGTADADPEGLFGVVSGRMEGDVLVVESRGYPPSKWGLAVATLNGRGADVPSSGEKVVTERFVASADGLSLTYQYTMEDPVYLSASVTDEAVFSRISADGPMAPFECDLESARRFSESR